MGNCMEACLRREEIEESIHQELETEEKTSEILKAEKEMEKKGNNSMRIKIVLTKEELEMLFLQLKLKEEKSLEDFLEEIKRRRERRDSKWKPSLESITESPVPEIMDTS
ncbi:hypothetical protein A4A49_62763 [Nicotiana attenuata]|uniref:Uncharacterized protein n=1 Tax=Nicotiana attenuata TaxID=49451 RepID=A0A1J6JWK4_NICAT|nr:hypothetical protein A4A49_62763 [Nicotiana attenuata]